MKSSVLEKESPFDVDTMSRGEFEVSVADDIGLEEDDEVELDLEDLATLVKEINADESLGGSLEKEEEEPLVRLDDVKGEEIADWHLSIESLLETGDDGSVSGEDIFSGGGTHLPVEVSSKPETDKKTEEI